MPGSEDFLNAQLNRMAVNWHRKYEGIDVQITRADFGRLLADVGKERFACAVQACIDTLIFFPSIAEFRQRVPPPTPRRPRNADDEERLTPQEKLAKWKRESKGQETFGIADLIAEKLPHKSEYDPNYKPELSDEELDALRSAKKAELQQQTNDALARFTEAPEETLVAPDSIKIDTATDMPYRLPGRFTRQEAPTSYQMPFSRARRRSIA